jgi:hypothetical protein
MTFVSHIVPAAATLVAFACLPSPALAGVALAISTGAGFYPAFMVPAWVGFCGEAARDVCALSPASRLPQRHRREHVDIVASGQRAKPRRHDPERHARASHRPCGIRSKSVRILGIARRDQAG